MASATVGPVCSNYRPVTRLDRLLTFFGVERHAGAMPPDADVFPLGLAPFIRLDPNADPADTSRPLVAEAAVFGLLPQFATELAYGRRTYNARSETVHQLASFRQSWAKGWRCIIPAECIYAPSYETGKCVWWGIGQPGATPMGIAGVYREWRAPDGRKLWSMAMLTVDAKGHPVMQRFHKEADKRMTIILDPSEYGEWLTCPVDQAPKFFRNSTGPLETWVRDSPRDAPQAADGGLL